MAGLACVRELEQRQVELRERRREMLRRSLKTLNKLNKAKARKKKKRKAKEA